MALTGHSSSYIERIRRQPSLVWWPAALWAAWFLLNLGYGVLRGFGADTFEPRGFEGYEQSVFGFTPTRWLQSELYQRDLPWLDYIAFLMHGIWFGLPFAFGLVVMRYERARLVEFLTWTTVAVYLGAIMFILIPVRPPWMETGVTRVLMARNFGGYAGLDDNPYAAFPSLHAGVSMLIALFIYVRCPRQRVFAWVAFAFAVGIAGSVVYMGEHWLLDVFAGWGVAALTAWMCMSSRMGSVYARIPGDPVGWVARKNAAIYSECGEPVPLPLPLPAAESEAA